MSIQAGWNSALYQLGLIGGIGSAKKEAKKVGEQVSNISQEITAEQLAQTSAERNRQAMNPDFVGPLTAGQATQRQGEILRNRARQARQWMNGEFVGPLTAHQQSRMDPNFFSRQQGFTTVGARSIPPEVAAERAQEAARVADSAPRNTIAGARQALENDPMEALRNMTNEQMGTMDRMAQDRRDDMLGGGN